LERKRQFSIDIRSYMRLSRNTYRKSSIVTIHSHFLCLQYLFNFGWKYAQSTFWRKYDTSANSFSYARWFSIAGDWGTSPLPNS